MPRPKPTKTKLELLRERSFAIRQAMYGSSSHRPPSLPAPSPLMRVRPVDEARAAAEGTKTTRQIIEELTRPTNAAKGMAARKAFTETEEGNYFQYAEVHRICDLPVREGMAPEEIEYFQRTHVQAEAYQEGFRLLPKQIEAVLEYELTGGLVAPLGVGSGKTLVTLMVANKAYQKGLRKMLLLVPSQVLAQLVHADIRWARARVAINYPIHVMGGRSAPERRSLTRSGKPGLYILPYSLLSVKDTDEMLQGIAPQVIIADEGHNLSNRNSARSRRLMKFVEQHKPEGGVLSGTLTAKSPKDFAHLSQWSLGKNNPLPNAKSLADEWASVIDAEASDSVAGNTSRTGPLMPLVAWAKKHFPEETFTDNVSGFRKAFRLRFNSAPGVVASGDLDIGTSLILHNHRIPENKYRAAHGWDRLEELIEQVNESWLTPNGDEIEHAIHTWKWLNELTSGFYNELVWPVPQQYIEHRPGMSESRAEDLLERAKIHHAAGQEYSRALRQFLQKGGKPGIDTPMLVGHSMYQHQDRYVPHELYRLWVEHRELDFEGRPERTRRAVRVCSFKVDLAVQWALSLPKRKGAILWVTHQEMGRWLRDAMREAGMEDVLYCPAGDRYNMAIIDPANANKKIIASIPAHGTGKNLQHFQEQFFVQWPRQARAAEQVLGRLHRQGQRADEIVANTNMSLEFDDLNFAACVNDALYIHQTTGNKQKLVYASYDPLPKIFPSEVLRERGLQNELLNREQRRILEDKFGVGP